MFVIQKNKTTAGSSCSKQVHPQTGKMKFNRTDPVTNRPPVKTMPVKTMCLHQEVAFLLVPHAKRSNRAPYVFCKNITPAQTTRRNIGSISHAHCLTPGQELDIHFLKWQGFPVNFHSTNQKGGPLFASGSKIVPPEKRTVESMFPCTRVPFWIPLLDPFENPSSKFAGCCTTSFQCSSRKSQQAASRVCQGLLAHMGPSFFRLDPHGATVFLLASRYEATKEGYRLQKETHPHLGYTLILGVDNEQYPEARGSKDLLSSILLSRQSE